MANPVKLGTQAIGAAGELLVQYRLLKSGIDSARLTTDSGIDLVMYVPTDSNALTVQVKTKHKPVPAGGKGKPSLGWPVPLHCPAQYLACVDLSRDAVWLFSLDEARSLAKQSPPQLYWYTGAGPEGALHESEMDRHRLETVVERLVNGEPRRLP